MICPKCKKELADDAIMCSNCGWEKGEDLEPEEKVEVKEEPKEEPKEENPQEDNPKKDTKEEKSIEAKEEKEAPKEEKKKDKSFREFFKSKNFKFCLICLVGILLLLVLIIILVNCRKKKEVVPDSGLVFTVGETVYYTDMKSKPVELNVKSNGSNYVLTEDQKYVLYESGGNLYRSSVKSSSKEYVKVAADVDDYHLSKNGNIVTYIKDNNLYQYNITKDSRTDAIAKNVTSFRTSDDGSKLLYRRTLDSGDKELVYRKSASSDEVILNSNVGSYYVNEDFTKVIYVTPDSKLYYQKLGSSAVLLTEKYNNLYRSNKDFNYFFFTETVDGNTKLQLCKNGKVSEVANIKNIISYLDDECYYTVKDGDNTKLFFFNGKSSTELSLFTSSTLRSSEKMVLVYSITEGENTTYKLAKGKTVYDIKTNGKASNFAFTKDLDTLYFLDNYNTDTYIGTLVKASVGSGVKNPKEYASNVSGYMIDEDDDILYESDDNLYWNKKLVETEVNTTLQNIYGKANGKYFYQKDGDLFVSTGGRGKRIVSDVYFVRITEDGKVLIQTNYNQTSNTVTISYYTSKLVKIMDSVDANIKFVYNDKGDSRYH